MIDYTTVNTFISEYIVNTTTWDRSDEQTKQRAINAGFLALKNFYKRDEFTAEVVAYQALWELAQDDVIERSDLGVTHTQIDGINISVRQTDRRIAPKVLQLLGGGRRVGRYTKPGGYVV